MLCCCEVLVVRVESDDEVPMRQHCDDEIWEDLRAVCLVRAIADRCDDDLYEDELIVWRFLWLMELNRCNLMTI